MEGMSIKLQNIKIIKGIFFSDSEDGHIQFGFFWYLFHIHFPGPDESIFRHFLQKTPKLLRKHLRKFCSKGLFLPILRPENYKKSNKIKFFLTDYQYNKKKIKKKWV